MNLNYKGLMNILGLKSLIDRVITLEASVENLPALDGNGMYSGGGEIPAITYAFLNEAGESGVDFALGVFPNFPSVNRTVGERGFHIGKDWTNAVGLNFNANSFFAYSNGSQMNGADGRSLAMFTSGVVINCPSEADEQTYYTFKDRITLNHQNLRVASIVWGTGTPEGVVTATVGSLYLRTDGGVNTTLYVKQTGTSNTGWAAK